MKCSLLLANHLFLLLLLLLLLLLSMPARKLPSEL